MDTTNTTDILKTARKLWHTDPDKLLDILDKVALEKGYEKTQIEIIRTGVIAWVEAVGNVERANKALKEIEGGLIEITQTKEEKLKEIERSIETHKGTASHFGSQAEKAEVEAVEASEELAGLDSAEGLTKGQVSYRKRKARSKIKELGEWASHFREAQAREEKKVAEALMERAEVEAQERI